MLAFCYNYRIQRVHLFSAITSALDCHEYIFDLFACIQLLRLYSAYTLVFGYHIFKLQYAFTRQQVTQQYVTIRQYAINQAISDAHNKSIFQIR